MFSPAAAVSLLLVVSKSLHQTKSLQSLGKPRSRFSTGWSPEGCRVGPVFLLFFSRPAVLHACAGKAFSEQEKRVCCNKRTTTVFSCQFRFLLYVPPVVVDCSYILFTGAAVFSPVCEATVFLRAPRAHRLGCPCCLRGGAPVFSPIARRPSLSLGKPPARIPVRCGLGCCRARLVFLCHSILLVNVNQLFWAVSPQQTHLSLCALHGLMTDLRTQRGGLHSQWTLVWRGLSFFPLFQNAAVFVE